MEKLVKLKIILSKIKNSIYEQPGTVEKHNIFLMMFMDIITTQHPFQKEVAEKLYRKNPKDAARQRERYQGGGARISNWVGNRALT
jgi:hypothetical protein